MGTLTFKAADLARVVEHSLAAPAQSEQLVDYVDGKAVTRPVEAPSVILVHDQGIYLMSNGEPGDPLDPSKAGEQFFRRYVAYAEGCHPEKDAGWWDTARALVGGDDFGETLPWAGEIKVALDGGATHIDVLFTDANVQMFVRMPPRRKAGAR